MHNFSNHPNLPFVRSLIQGYCTSNADPWRHDFVESEQERIDSDDTRRETILDDIASYLEIVDRVDAEKVLDHYESIYR